MKTRGLLAVVLVVSALSLAACKRSSAIAEVIRPTGEVKRDTAATLAKWEPAADGSKLELGDGVKTSERSTAVVKLVSGGSIAVASNTTLRLLAGKPGAKPKVGIEAGEATIEAESGALDLETTIGNARIEAGGKLRVSAGDAGTRVEVTVGAAHIDTESGGVDLSPGKSFDIAVGGAIVEREVNGVDAGDAPPKAAAAERPVTADDGKVVLSVHGSGVRVQTKGASTWKALSNGAADAAAGDTIDLPSGASVDVERGRMRGRLVGQGRFVLGEGALLARATAGRVELEATSDDVSIEVPGGTIVAKGGAETGKSRLTADVKSNETKVTVRQGQGEVRGKDHDESVRAGENATLNGKGVVVVAARSLERADMAVRAGDSIVVRDPRGATAVGFDVSSVCPGAAVVSRGAENAGAVRGDRRVNMLVPGGYHEYAVRCIGADGVEEKAAATGTVTVIADAARAELPMIPPATLVDMDGRRYTVLYQNQLPSVIARWADAPAGKPLTLHLDKDRIKAETSKKELKAGSVSEGTHTLWFETADGAKKSAETTLVIKFDNAAPAASVREPADGSFSPGDSVKVAGVVVEGWTVQVNGTPVALDEQKRFSTTTTVPAESTAIVLKLSHPKRRTVFYVRHAAAAR